MKPLVAALAIASFAGLFATGDAVAQDSGWMVRGRLTHLGMDNKSDAALGGAVPADAITVNNKWIPELDVSYFFNKNVAAELVLTIPQKQDVSISGGKIGTFKHLPPTLLAQWHFDGMGAFKPYVGLGINYTIFGSENMSVAGTPVTLSNSSVGPAVQLGVDYKLSGKWYLNADLKKVYIKTDVNLGGNKISSLSVDPLLLSIGVGYRF
jgi:outer membrane protein